MNMSRMESKLAPLLSMTVSQGISAMLFNSPRREYQLYPKRSLMFKGIPAKRNVLVSNNVCQNHFSLRPMPRRAISPFSGIQTKLYLISLKICSSKSREDYREE